MNEFIKEITIQSNEITTYYKIEDFIENVFISKLDAYSNSHKKFPSIHIFNTNQNLKNLEIDSYSMLDKIVRFLYDFNSKNEKQITKFELKYKCFDKNNLNSLYCIGKIELIHDDTILQPKIYIENFDTNLNLIIDKFIENFTSEN